MVLLLLYDCTWKRVGNITRKLPRHLCFISHLRIQRTLPLSSSKSRNSFTVSLVISQLSMVIIQEASSSSSSSTHPWEHHVFLSFRGEDTRNNFTGHLCNALRREGIITFMDDQIRRGEEISTALIQAIEQSRISIIVFSKNYASSRWCLDELVKILDCKRSNQQEVRPVFYKVHPSDIRNHRGSFGEALANHECKFKDNPDKVQKWKDALSEAAHLLGWHLLDEHCSESNVINQIVEEISVKVIERTYLEVTKYPVGIESRVQNVHRLLGVEGKDVHMVGIWGTGGIGKTTIAKAVYNSIAHEFDGSCFLENVRENSMRDRGFIKLQKTLLFEILGGTKLKVANVARGINMIKDRLQNKRVLLVLDDVNDMDQLNKLAGDPSWFGMGSKIIITTRDKELLTGHGVSLIYKVKELAHHEALELFCRNAFKRNGPLDGFAELTEGAIRYAQGLPLALSVLGSSLCGRNVERWQAAVEGFKSPTIRKVLQISYEGLDDTVKEIFLDIACFFKGEYRDHVIQTLEACCRKSAEDGINVLIDKALINTSTGHIWMHDLLEELGRDIVHKESPNDPGERSRLWFHKDVYRVLTANTGTTKVIGIKVELPKDSDVICLSETTFSSMRNLRLFIHRVGRYSGAVDSLPNSLRVVDWPEYPLPFLPSNLIQRELAVINMPRSHITVLGDGYKHLTSINLSDCQYLKKVSDLSGSPNLRHLYLDECRSLVEVHPSVGFLDKLEYLSLSDCSRLETFLIEVNWKSMRTLMLPFCGRLENFIKIGHNMESIQILDLMESGIKELQSWIGRCISLEVLNLHGTSIKQLPSSEIENLTSLRELDLFGTPLEELPSLIGCCTSLEILNAYGTNIEELPSSIGYCTSLSELILCRTFIEELPSSIGNLTSLRKLNVSETSITELPSSIGNLTSLVRLKLSKTPIKELPSSIGNLISLVRLELSKTPIKELPSSIGNLTSLVRLELSKTPIKELPSSIGNLTSLLYLDVSETSISGLPSSIGNLTSLGELNVSETSISELPSSIGNLTFLGQLNVSKTSITVLPSSIGNLTSLVGLELSKTPIKELPSSIGNLTSLVYLDISETSISELPSSIGNLTSLGELNVSKTSITELPSSIGNLTSLVGLELSKTPIKELPSSIGNLTSLGELNVSETSISELPSSIGNLTSLVELNVSETSISELPSSIRNLTSLWRLNVSETSISELPSSIGNLTSLWKLNVSETSITELPSSIGNLTSLVRLELSKTPIKELPSSIGNLTSLLYLDVSETSISELPSSIGNLTSLGELNVSETSISELPSSIGNLTSLGQLNVSKTSITELPSSIGNLTFLVGLELSKTPIKELPSSIGNLTSLGELNVSETSISELSSSIGNLTSLVELNVSETSISELPSSIGNLTSLVELNVSETSISELPSSIRNLTSLWRLNVSETSISELPSSIGNLTSLWTLNVSETSITELPSSIGNLTSLGQLNVSKTSITELSSSIGNLTSLVYLHASETLIEELPLSIGNLNRLEELELKRCANLTNVPHSVYGGLQRLGYLILSWCPKLVTFPSRGSALVSSSAESLPSMLPSNSNNGHDDHPGSLLFPQLRWLFFEGCQLSVFSDFLTNLDCVSTLQELNLSGSSFDSLPECITKFHGLDYLDLSGCKRLRDISELPPNIRVIKLDDCVSLERFSKLSNILEQKDTPGLLDKMNLSNCNRLMDKLGMDVVSKMAKALLNQLVHAGLHQHLQCWNLVLPSLQEIEVPNWFDGGELDTSVLPGHGTHGICEILIKIPRNLKAERIGLVVCLVFELTPGYLKDFSSCTVKVVIDKNVSYHSTCNFFKSKARESSALDHVLVHLTCIAFKVVDLVVRVSASALFFHARGLLLKNFGVHLANMKEDHVSGEDLAREKYRQSSASISDQVALHAEGAAVASLVSDDSNYGKVRDDHHNGEVHDDHHNGEQEREREQEPHRPTKRLKTWQDKKI